MHFILLLLTFIGGDMVSAALEVLLIGNNKGQTIVDCPLL